MRILIVEDEPLIALDLETAVTDQHGTVVGPASTLEDGQRLAETDSFDGAILDLRLQEELASSIAECLLARGIPFVIYSGQPEITAPRAWPSVPIISKPALPEKVISMLAAVIRRKS